MDIYKVFGVHGLQSVASLLMSTGQEHEVPFNDRYDRVLALRGMEQCPQGQWTEGVIAACGINDEENRIVDIAVHPEFRRKGLGRLLVELSGCTTAYVVTDEARDFWNALEWEYNGTTKDKGTIVNVWVRPDA